MDYGDDDDDDGSAGTEFRGWDHALGGFTCYKCQVTAQTGHSFGDGEHDELLGMLERQRQLDVAHHTADSTAAGYLGHLRRVILWQGDVGVQAVAAYPARTPRAGDGAVSIAWHVLLRSLDPGREAGSTLAAASLAKVRSALTCAHDSTTEWSLAGSRMRQRFPLAPTLSNQYEWFVQGLERRLGTDTQQAYVFSFAAFVAVVEGLEASFATAAAAPTARVRGSAAWSALWGLAHEGLFWHVGFFGAFRAGEALRVGWAQTELDQRLGGDVDEPHLRLVVTKTKNSQSKSITVLLAATSWHPSPCTRRWYLRVAELRRHASVQFRALRAVRLFATPSGKTWSPNFVLDHIIRPRLQCIQAQSPQLIAAKVCIAKDVTGNSMRRSATTAMQASGKVPDHIMDGHCRWKLEAHMRDVYNNAPLSDKLKASLCMSDATRIVQRPNSPAARPVLRQILQSDSSNSDSN